MTDKTIINGIDVSKCSNYDQDSFFECENSYCHCDEILNCYFKQLKRKEQECEELKEKCNKYQNEICPQYSEELKQAYTRANKAEQECEEYKHVLDSLEQFCKENKQTFEIAKDIVMKYREPYFKEKIEKENFDFFHKAEDGE